ncbi:lipopolysaccharide biosynthesis protein [Mycobacterium sp. M26]|uniref:lipopolysaccharide biosynthesis protein n=1 Tax=Mycobacterium sp. M26 TaxID=1762962 RepID=UPI0012E33867|nr:lipopolysaccharide biosynthesis protein [Mycobacterium sp. M26]
MNRFLGPVAARYASIAVQFGVVAVITRALDQHDAGNYFVTMGFVTATYFIAGLGLPDGVVRYAPALMATGRESEGRALLRGGLRYSLLTIPIGAGITGCAIGIYLGATDVGILSGVWWGCYGVIFVCAQSLVASSRSELGTAVFYSAASAGQLLISVPMIVLGHLDRLDSVLMAMVLGTAAAACVSVAIALRLRAHASGAAIGPETLRGVWQQGMLIAVGRVAQSCLIWSPVWVVSMTLGASDAALVGLASRLVNAVAAVLAAVRFSIRPSLAQDAAQGNWRTIETQSSRIAAFATTLSVTAALAMATIGEPLIAFLFGPAYRGVGIITAIMLISTIGESLGGPVDEVLRMSGHAREVILAQLVVLVVAFAAQAFVALHAGLHAAVATYGLMYVALFAIFIGRLHRLHGILIAPRLLAIPR